MSPKLPSSSPWNIHTHSHAHTHTHNIHTHNGHPFSFLLLWWGVSVFCGPWLLGDPKTVTTRHKSVAAEETGHWIDETGDRPTRQTLDRGRKRKKTGNIFRLGRVGPAQAQILSPPHPHRNTILRSTGLARVCLTFAVWPIYLFIRGSPLLPKTDTLLLLFNYKTFQKFQEESRSNYVQFNLFAGHPTCFAI